MSYICLDCGAIFDAPAWEEAYIELGELGRKQEWIGHCPDCGSEEYDEGHDCENPGCGGFALAGNKLCGDCFKNFVKKFLTFMASLSSAEVEVLAEITEGSYLDEVAEKLRKEHARDEP